MQKLHLKFSKTVSFWNTDEGAEVKVDGTRDNTRWGVDLHFWDGFVVIDGVQDIQKAVLDYLNKWLDVRGGVTAEHLSIADDGRIWICLIENGNGDPIHCEDTYSKKNPNTQLYICDYDVLVEVHEVYTPTKEKLAKLLPNAERMD